MESSVGEDCSQMDFTNKSCFKFNETGFKAVVGCRTGFSILGVLISLLAILYIVRRRAWKKMGPAGRLALYLCIASLFHGIITALQIAPVIGRLKCDHISANCFCATTAVLLLYSAWTVLVLMIWVNVEIIMVTSKLTAEEKGKDPPCCVERYTNCKESYRCYDGCVWATTLLVPILPCIIPAITKSYGLAGAWCWIKARDDECEKIKAGVAEQFLLWYAWAMLFIVVFFLTLLHGWYKITKIKQSGCDHPDFKNKYKLYLKEICHLCLYPIIFSVIYGIGIVNRILYAHEDNQQNILWLWILHALADALISLLIPVFFLLHLFHVWCNERKNNLEEQSLILN